MFYKLMSAKYANRRTFSPETGAAAGAAVEANPQAAADGNANAAADAANVAAAGQGGDGGSQVTVPAAAAAAEAATGAPKTDDEKAALIREVMEKKGKLKDVEEKLKGFEGVDVAKYRELVAKEQEAERLAAEAKGDFDRVKAMMAEAHAGEKAELERQLQEARDALGSKDSTINELTIGNDFGNSSFIQKDLILSPAKTRVLYGAHFEVEDGKTVGYDKPRGEAGRTKLVDSSGKALSFNDALTKIVNADPDKKSVLRAPAAKPGAGSATTSSAGAKETGKGQELFGAARIRASLGG